MNTETPIESPALEKAIIEPSPPVKRRFGDGLPGPGRPKGSKSNMPRNAREDLQKAFEEIGGVKGLAIWGRKHPSAFYALWAKLIVTEVKSTNTSHRVSVDIDLETFLEARKNVIDRI